MSENQTMAEAHEDKDGFLRRSDMTLRDYFAGQALNGLLSNNDTNLRHKDICMNLSESAYKLADYMLEARK